MRIILKIRSRPGPRQPLLRRLHRWLGLGAGTLLAVLGLSGTLLVYGTEVDAWLNPGLRQVEVGASRASLVDLVAVVEQGLGEIPAGLHVHEDPRLAVEVWLDPSARRRAYLDPYRPRILGVRDEQASLVGFVRALHVDLLTGEAGHRVVGVLGLALMLLCATGLARWWPGRRSWREALSLRRPLSGVRGAFDLHKLGGICSTVLLLLAGLSGATLVFGGFVTGLVGTASEPLPALTPRQEPLSLRRLDAWVALADQALPGGRVVRIQLPARATEPVRIRKRMPGEVHPNGMTFIHIDPAGAVMRVDDARRASRGDRLLALRFPVHTGVLFGAAGRLLTAVGGLAAAWLAATGLLLWARRRGPAPQRHPSLTPPQSPRNANASP